MTNNRDTEQGDELRKLYERCDVSNNQVDPISFEEFKAHIQRECLKVGIKSARDMASLWLQVGDQEYGAKIDIKLAQLQAELDNLGVQ